MEVAENPSVDEPFPVWRVLAFRCRDVANGSVGPYFETKITSLMRITLMALETGTILVEPVIGGQLLLDHLPDKDKSHAKTFVGYKAIKSA